MEFKLIKTQEDYNEALTYIEDLADREDFATSSRLVEEFELLSELIKIYDRENFGLPGADPIEVIKLKMAYKGISRKELAHIGSSGIISEVFSKKRALSKNMIREFSILLDLSQDLLNKPYELVGNDAVKARNAPVKIVKMEQVKKRRTLSPFKFLADPAVELSGYASRVRSRGMILNLCAV